MGWGRGLVISWLTNVPEVLRFLSRKHKMAAKALSSTFQFKAGRRGTGEGQQPVAFVEKIHAFPEAPFLLSVNHPLSCIVRAESCDPTPCCKEGWERREQACHDWFRSIMIYR